MSTVIAKNVQIGTSGTSTDNFTIFQPATPDGTLRIGNGNTGITTSQVALTSAGNVGIGTSSPGHKLQVNGAIVSTDGTTTVRMIPSGGVGLVSTITNHPLAFQTNDTEQARITTAGLFQFNSGYGSVATAYGCRAWINFNGTGTPAIRGSGNFSSITDNGTGDYTLNFTTSLPDTNYCPVVGGDFSQGATRDNGMYLPTNFTFATSSLRISVTNYAGAYTDIDTVMVSIFR